MRIDRLGDARPVQGHVAAGRADALSGERPQGVFGQVMGLVAVAVTSTSTLIELGAAQIGADTQRLDQARQARDRRIAQHVARTLAVLRQAASGTERQRG